MGGCPGTCAPAADARRQAAARDARLLDFSMFAPELHQEPSAGSSATVRPFDSRRFGYAEMLLTITTTIAPATDLGYLLAKNPAPRAWSGSCDASRSGASTSASSACSRWRASQWTRVSDAYW